MQVLPLGLTDEALFSLCRSVCSPSLPSSLFKERSECASAVREPELASGQMGKIGFSQNCGETGKESPGQRPFILETAQTDGPFYPQVAWGPLDGGLLRAGVGGEWRVRGILVNLPWQDSCSRQARGSDITWGRRGDGDLLRYQGGAEVGGSLN